MTRHPSERDAWHVEDDFDGAIGLEDILQWQTFAGHHVSAIGPAAREVLEQPTDFVAKITNVSRHEQARDGAHGERCSKFRVQSSGLIQNPT